MLSLTKLFIAATLLSATIVGSSAQGQHARTSPVPSGPSAGNFEVLCQPGFVYKCSNLGCFCVRP